MDYMKRFLPIIVVNVTSTMAAVVLFLNELAGAGLLFAVVAAITAISVPAQMNPQNK